VPSGNDFVRAWLLRLLPGERWPKLLIVATLAAGAIEAQAKISPGLAAPSASGAHNEVLIKNAVVMTVTHGNIRQGEIYISNGKIVAVGMKLTVPATTVVIDAGGKYVTPGIVDCHSHIALGGNPDPESGSDVNEATNPITPEMMMVDAFNYQDKAIYRTLAGGVTTSMLLHGSANMIGGQAVVIKHKYGTGREAMLFPGAPRSIKFASGENPKRTYGQERGQFPATRMGNFAVQRDALAQAQDYIRDWDDYNAKVKSGNPDVKMPKHDLKLDEETCWSRSTVTVPTSS